MDILELMEKRHSVRQFEDRPIEDQLVDILQSEISTCNEESGLHFQLFTEEPNAFAANQPHYGSFVGCRNYIALVGPKHSDTKVGYYGERVALKAQELGLNTCWVYLTYKKGGVKPALETGEVLYLLIALGYGSNQGVPHKSKKLERLCNYDEEDSPEWFKRGMKAVLLAPTAMNQQMFYFHQEGNIVAARSRKVFLGKIDLGIAKYHFEVAAGKENFKWA